MSPRLIDTIGRAMLALYVVALASLDVALWLRATVPAFLFLGSMVGCGLTLCAISLVERRRP